jgi:hypothetical protein
MKANLKGKGSPLGLLLLHGEKIGMVVVGICAVMFLYSSLSQERLRGDYKADSLTSQIRQARQAVEQYQWDQAPEKCVAQPLRDIDDIAVQEEPYRVASGGWNPPVVPPIVLRTDPVLLPAVDVQGRGGSGLLAFIDEEIQKQRALERQAEADREARDRERDAARQEPTDDRGRRRDRDDDTTAGPDDARRSSRRPAGGGFRPEGVPLQEDERVELAYWACVVAKVPVKEQLRLYRDVFENARGGDQANDFPEYLGFYVQRAEIRPGQPFQWAPVAVYDGQGKYIEKGMAAKVIPQIVKDWAAETPEVVDPRYIAPVLAFPLPPLVGRDWGSEATHPDIPLASDAVDEPAEDDTPAATEDVGDTREGNNASDLFSQPDPSLSTRGPSARSGMPRNFGGARPSMHGGMRFPGPVPRPSMNAIPSGGGVYTGRDMGHQRTALPHGVTCWLVRFFDFNVQPGKKYKYQVRLVVADPNQGVLKKWLDASVLERMEKDRNPLRLTDWSEPSATIGIPDAGSVRLAEAKTPSDKVFNDEPGVTLLVESFDVDDSGKAMQAQKEKYFRRGSVANMTEDAKILVDQNQFIEQVESFRFHTGITVLDMCGGNRLNRDMSQPASVLLMSSAGQLSVRNELDDADEVERFKTTFAKDTTRRGRNDPADDRHDAGPGGFRGRIPIPSGGGFNEGF